MKILAKLLAAVLLAASLFCSLLSAQSAKPPAAASASRAYRIAGIVVNANTSQPLAGVRVSVANTKNSKDTQTTVAGDDGRFQFQVAAGKYSLRGAKRGFVSYAYEQHETFWTGIVTGGGLDTENLALRLPPVASITGTITDENGEPVRDATISVFRQDHRSGATRIQMYSGAATDDLGTFEVTPLEAGTYFVTATARPWYAVHPSSADPSLKGSDKTVDRTLDVAFPVSYFKDATEPDDATPVPIRAGDRAQVDIHMNPAPALHLFFRAGSNDPRGFNQPTFQKELFDGLLVAPPQYDVTDGPGVHEITGLAPGRYMLSTTLQGASKAPSPVDLTTDGQNLDFSEGPSAASIKALVQTTAKIPESLAIVLRNSRGRLVDRAEVNEQGVADFVNVTPGEYDLVAGTPDRAYSISTITIGEHVSPGHALRVPPGSALTVSLTLVGSAVSVEGIAQQAGKPFHGAMIVLVPNNPDADPELFRRDQSDLDGSFALQQVIPGTYTLMAIENGWDLDWAKPAVLAGYRRHGQRIIVGESGRGTLRVTTPVEVQPRL